MKNTIEKQQDKQRKNLQIIHNGIKAAYSFGEMEKTWGGLFKKLGYDDKWIDDNTNSIWNHDISDAENCHRYPSRDSELTFPELKDFLQKQVDELEKKLVAELGEAQSSEVVTPSSAPSQPQSNDLLLLHKELQREVLEKQTDKACEIATKNEPSDIVSEAARAIYSADNNYGLIESPNENTFLYWFQKKATAEILHKVVVEKKSGILVLAGTGTGKTFIAGAFFRRLMDMGYHEDKTLSHIPYLFISKATIVEQTGRVMKKRFNIEPNVDMEIINIEQLRSKRGEMWLKREPIIIDGEEHEKFIWKKGMNPCVVGFDESQGAKNPGSSQHKFMCAYTEIRKNAVMVSFSASPFVRVSEAKCFAISTHRPLEHLGFPQGTVLNENNWNSYAHIICGDKSDPEDYNEAAVERLMSDLDDYVVRVRGVRPQFEARNRVELVTPNQEEFLEYTKAWQKFQEEKAKLDMGASEHPFAILTAFSIAAESIKHKLFAKRLDEAVRNGYAVVLGVKWKKTIILTVRELIETYKWKRSDISLIWGGGQTAMNKKQKAKAKMRMMEDKFKKAGLDVEEMMKDLDLDKIEDYELIGVPKEYALGAQDLTERQSEIDNFQSGKSKFAIFTFKAGGVGLSLHHTDELTEFKCRRKESGYALEEDIPKVPTRQRKTFLAPSYSAIEMVQGSGRVPRLNSLSFTEQIMLFYKNTIEEDIAQIVSVKFRCLSKICGAQRESWADFILGKRTKEEVIKTTEGVKDDTGEIELTIESEDEEEAV
jgi:hypothetical protein